MRKATTKHSLERVPFQMPDKPESELSLKELKRLKTQWYEIARSSGVLHAIAVVATRRGRRCDAGEGTGLLWETPCGDEVLRVRLLDRCRHLDVRLGDRVLCRTRRGERLFVPGPWLEVVQRAYRVECEAMKREEAEGGEKDRSLLRAALGLA